jgi:serine/threonine protein kinase
MSALFDDVSRIGKGTYGVVFRARLRKTGEVVALKEIALQSASEGIPCTALREIGVLQNVSHPNVVRLKMVYRTSARLTLVFEHCPGDLQQYMALHSNCLPRADVLGFSAQLLRGLAAIHARGIIHRDVKPQNLLIGRDRVLRLCDFGLARVMGIPFCELSADVVTQWYRPPEILLKLGDYGLGVDVWSAGCVIAEMATSLPLFPCQRDYEQLVRIFGMLGIPREQDWPGARESPAFPTQRDVVVGMGLREVMRGCDPLLVDLVERMLCVNPAARISAEEALRHPVFAEIERK